ncbi:MAG: hypothetical protein M1834_003860 [Cirrosporium novae-zelandiae]|nr:MAG: hypothetical protein M1834_003860 [Cirrosporium novae-zelandiae]
MTRTDPPLSSVLPPLICGTATFNSQYNRDPYALPTTGIVHQALSLGVRAFDTSPYYGPAENLLGQALDTPFVRDNFPRDEYYLLTKVGRISSEEFDYSPSWVRYSVQRSLRRLKTDYLDVVYCHDVEFVSPEEVLAAIVELRRLRDDLGVIKYVGISGYPVDRLCDLAELVLEKTGEPLDAVMSYANFTLQNNRLKSHGISRLQAAGVDVVPNASPLGMGLLRRGGVPIGSQGDFHPAGDGLRAAVHRASEWTDARGEKLEVVAIRYALETWICEGSSVGSKGDPASGVSWQRETIEDVGGKKLGVNVMGVSNIEELHETMRVWRSILDGMEDGKETAIKAGRAVSDHNWSLQRKKQIQDLTVGARKILGKYVDFAWDSPGGGFVNKRKKDDIGRPVKESLLAGESFAEPLGISVRPDGAVKEAQKSSRL